MADTPEDDELLLDTPVTDGNEGEQGLSEAGEEAEDELEVTFGDEAAPASGERETGLAKHLREEIRRRDKEIADLRRTQPPAQKIEVGPKPTLEDFDYDEDKRDAAYEAWLRRKGEAERAETEAQRHQREADEVWQSEVQVFESKRAQLNTPRAQDAIDTAISALNEVQQAVIVKVADNSANVLCALGMHPAKLAEIAAIQDPLKQAAAIVKLEGTLKVTTKRRAPEPEEIARGSAAVSGGTDQTLARLMKEAEKTGERTKLIAYKQKLQSRAT